MLSSQSVHKEFYSTLFFNLNIFLQKSTPPLLFLIKGLLEKEPHILHDHTSVRAWFWSSQQNKATSTVSPTLKVCPSPWTKSWVSSVSLQVWLFHLATHTWKREGLGFNDHLGESTTVLLETWTVALASFQESSISLFLSHSKYVTLFYWQQQ